MEYFIQGLKMSLTDITILFVGIICFYLHFKIGVKEDKE